MSTVEFLDLEDLIELVRRLGVGPVRDIGLLDAAAARPRSSAYGSDAYPSLELKAAALLHSLVRNHALELKAAALLHSLVRNHALGGGNKRLAWLATVVFLDLNERTVVLDDDEAFTLVMDAAGGSSTSRRSPNASPPAPAHRHWSPRRGRDAAVSCRCPTDDYGPLSTRVLVECGPRTERPEVARPRPRSLSL